jgi:hypothetical protein
LGKFIGTGVDKWAFYRIGQYCDELVDDGNGGSVAQTATLTITGSNDAPTVTAGTPSATLVEAGGVSNGTAGTASSTISLSKGDLDGTAEWDSAWLLANGWSTAQMIRRGFRPRVLIYTGILVAITVALGVSLYLRTPLKVDVIRDRGALARMVEQGRIENVYRLQLMNATEATQVYKDLCRESRISMVPCTPLAAPEPDRRRCREPEVLPLSEFKLRVGP